jgi:predicted lipoprotein with Yx(FWY)xxD motif
MTPIALPGSVSARRPALALTAWAFLALLPACASLAPAPARVSDGILTDPRGMTLYTFDSDPAGRSTCNGPCAANWPPLAAPADARAPAGYSVVVRDDGSRQWAYQGKPLYLWVKDAKPGDRTGDGFRNVWRVARP